MSNCHLSVVIFNVTCGNSVINYTIYLSGHPNLSTFFATVIFKFFLWASTIGIQ
jgi:hypothetical protein